MLGGVHILNITGCDKITDVSMLGGIYLIKLDGCYKITDTSMLNKFIHV